MRLNGRVFTITGVAPPGFRGIRLLGFWPEMWVPIGMHEVIQPGSTGMLQGRGGGNLMLVGRMKPGLDRYRTQAAGERFAAQLAPAYPASNATLSTLAVPARSVRESRVREAGRAHAVVRAGDLRVARDAPRHLRQPRGSP
ncbi:MAG: hypothetical protein ACT4PJ_03715 [Gemmatimonadaceae bacterium]